MTAKSDLGFASIVLGCVWTVAAVMLLTQGARARTPTALVAQVCLVGTIGCALLAFACFPRFVQRLRILGWLTVIAASLLALAVAHSVYFLRFPRTLEEQWTGIEALVVLGLLGLVGLFTSYRTPLWLWVHRGLAVLVVIVLTLHWPPFLYIEAGALLVLIVTALVNMKLAVLIVQHALGND